MAKKKKRRPSPSARHAGSGSTTATEPREAAGVPADTAETETGPARQNRAARKEEARRQREALRRKMARRRYYRIGAVVVVLAVIVGGGGFYFLTRPNPADAAGCGSVQTIDQYPGGQDRAHIGTPSATNEEVSQRPDLSSYPSTPPASGPHDPQPLTSGVYADPPDVYQAIHSLEHGAVIIWYRPGANADQLQKVRNYYSQATNQDHVIVAPYDYPDQGDAGHLPAGEDMALVAWHHIQTCDQVSLAAAQSFANGYRFNTSRPADYVGDAPEAGGPI